MTGVRLAPVPQVQREVLARLLQLYIYDFTEFEPRPLDEEGHYPYAYLDEYWAPAPGEARFAYFIRLEDGELAGFVLIRALNGVNIMSEFFVMRPHRRHHIGAAAALLALRAHPGQWVVHEHPRNLPAQAFWRMVIGEATGGRFTEQLEPDGAVTQRFAT